jgi:hypothetical protein
MVKKQRCGQRRKGFVGYSTTLLTLVRFFLLQTPFPPWQHIQGTFSAYLNAPIDDSSNPNLVQGFSNYGLQPTHHAMEIS